MSQRKLTNLVCEYLQAKQNRMAWSTKQLTERSFKYLIGLIGDIGLEFFTVKHAESFQNHLLDKYSKTTANIYVKTLRPVFRWAMREKWIETDVFNIPLPKDTTRRMRIYEPSEFQAMLDAANLMWRGRILLAKTSGMRRSEVLNINISDIDYDQGVIHIQPKKETRTTWAWEPKGKRSRTVPLTETTANVLMEIQDELPPGQAYLMLTELRCWRVLQMKRKGELPDRIRLCPDENFSTPFRRMIQRARVAHGTFHDLRKTYLTEMAEGGLPIHWLQKLAGHSSHETTMTYYIAIREKKMLTEARRLSQNIGVTRLERATPGPPDRCSTKLSYTPMTIGHH